MNLNRVYVGDIFEHHQNNIYINTVLPINRSKIGVFWLSSTKSLTSHNWSIDFFQKIYPYEKT